MGAQCDLAFAGGTAPVQRTAHGYPPVSAKVLSQRLRELEGRGVITRTIQPTSPPSVEYALTALGQELVPALSAIVAVGHRLKPRRARAAIARI